MDTVPVHFRGVVESVDEELKINKMQHFYKLLWLLMEIKKLKDLH